MLCAMYSSSKTSKGSGLVPSALSLKTEKVSYEVTHFPSTASRTRAPRAWHIPTIPRIYTSTRIPVLRVPGAMQVYVIFGANNWYTASYSRIFHGAEIHLLAGAGEHRHFVGITGRDWAGAALCNARAS